MKFKNLKILLCYAKLEILIKHWHNFQNMNTIDSLNVNCACDLNIDVHNILLQNTFKYLLIIFLDNFINNVMFPCKVHWSVGKVILNKYTLLYENHLKANYSWIGLSRTYVNIVSVVKISAAEIDFFLFFPF